MAASLTGKSAASVQIPYFASVSDAPSPSKGQPPFLFFLNDSGTYYLVVRSLNTSNEVIDVKVQLT